MKTLLHTTWLMMLSAVLGMSIATAAETGWLTDIEQAMERAKKEQKMVLVEFTGSDWCPPCMRMRKEVFSKKSFVEKASKRFVLVELDFPMANPALKKKNDRYAKQYRIEGMPMIVLLDDRGQEFHRFFASDYPDETQFLQYLDRVLERKDLD